MRERGRKKVARPFFEPAFRIWHRQSLPQAREGGSPRPSPPSQHHHGLQDERSLLLQDSSFARTRTSRNARSRSTSREREELSRGSEDAEGRELEAERFELYLPVQK